jgi:hypothetical protein
MWNRLRCIYVSTTTSQYLVSLLIVASPIHSPPLTCFKLKVLESNMDIFPINFLWQEKLYDTLISKDKLLTLMDHCCNMSSGPVVYLIKYHLILRSYTRSFYCLCTVFMVREHDLSYLERSNCYSNSGTQYRLLPYMYSRTRL